VNADIAGMAGQRATVAAPFVDPDFRRSILASVAGFVLALMATGLTLAFGPPAVVAYLAAAGLLVWAALTGRRSSARSRACFATRVEWKQAERQAVAAVLSSGLARIKGPEASRRSVA
jgi:hypothetical protein